MYGTGIMFDYQREAVEWMDIREQDTKTPGGFLCHEMGLGKTHMMCSHISKSMERASRTLLLTTKSTVRSWAATLRSYSNFAFDVREGIESVLTPGRPFVLVATHHSILKRGVYIPPVDRIVVDEAHIMRNQGKIFVKIKELSQAARFRWGITATPFNNHDSDITAYMRFLRPTDDTVTSRMFKHYFIRKLRKDVISGGPKLTVRKFVYDFETKEEQMMYDYVSGRIDDQHAWIQQNAGIIPWRQRGQMIFVLMLRQRQAAIHPQLVLNAEKVWAAQMPQNLQHVGDWDTSKVTKVNKIIEMIRADQKEGKSTMVVTHFGEELNLLKQRLTSAGIYVKVLNGKTSLDDRRKLETLETVKDTSKQVHHSLNEVQVLTQGKHIPYDVRNIISSFIAAPTVILLQIQAGGVGISLPWVNHVINAAPDWNPFLEQQSIYRAYRINTKHDVLVTSMYFRETIDIYIHARQTAKLQRGVEWMNDDPAVIEQYVNMPA